MPQENKFSRDELHTNIWLKDSFDICAVANGRKHADFAKNTGVTLESNVI